MRREQLTQKERKKLHWEYHKGEEFRKNIIHELFGHDITYESCMAMVDKYVEEDRLKGKVKAVAKPNEKDFWDYVCRAVYHGWVWGDNYQVNGNLREWVEIHCQVMGNPMWVEHHPDMKKFRVAPPVEEPKGFFLYKVKRWVIGSLDAVIERFLSKIVP